MHRHYTIDDFRSAIDGSGGYISLIAQRIGCALSTVYEWVDKNEEVRYLIERERVRQLDHAEGKLQSLINKENPTAIIFYLKTQGKQRGYVERQEVTGADGKPVSINLIPVRPDGEENDDDAEDE